MDIESGINFEINKYNLDDKLIEHQSSVARVNEELADLRSRKDSAYEMLKVKKANIANKIRNEKIANNEKITEAKLEELTLIDFSYVEALKDYLAISKAYNIKVGEKETLWSQEKVITLLAQLYGFQYWSLHAAEKGASTKGGFSNEQQNKG